MPEFFKKRNQESLEQERARKMEERKTRAVEFARQLLSVTNINLSIAEFWRLKTVSEDGKNLEGCGRIAYFVLRDMMRGFEELGLKLGEYEFGQKVSYERKKFNSYESNEAGDTVFVIEPEIEAVWLVDRDYGKYGKEVIRKAVVSGQPPKKQ